MLDMLLLKVLALQPRKEGIGSPNGFQLEPNTPQLTGNGRFEARRLVPCRVESALLGSWTHIIAFLKAFTLSQDDIESLLCIEHEFCGPIKG
jgi:hypothetical protein